MACLVILLLLSSPLFVAADVTPGVGGGVGVGNSNNLNYSINLLANPNYGEAASISGGVAGAINTVVNALADSHHSLDSAVVNGFADALMETLDTVTNIFRTGGGSAANITNALGQAATNLGNSIHPLSITLSGSVSAELQAAATKFVNALASLFKNPLNPLAYFEIGESLLGVAGAAFDGSANLLFGNLGTYSASASISGIVNVFENAFAELGL